MPCHEKRKIKKCRLQAHLTVSRDTSTQRPEEKKRQIETQRTHPSRTGDGTHLLALRVGAPLLAAGLIDDRDKALHVKHPLVRTADRLLRLGGLLDLGSLSLHLTSTRETTVNLAHSVFLCFSQTNEQTKKDNKQKKPD